MNNSGKFSATIHSTLKDLSDLADQVTDWGQRQGIPQKTLWKLCVILDELVTNTIVHGYRNADDGSIDIAIEASTTTIELTMQDRAPPFNPFDAPKADVSQDIEEREPGGLGIHFVREMASAVYHHYDGAMNEIRLTIEINATNDH